MASDRSSLEALRNLIADTDLILETTPALPQNRTAAFAREAVNRIAGLFEEFGRTLRPGDLNAMRTLNLSVIRSERFQTGLSYAEALSAAEELDGAVEAMNVAQQKKIALGLR